MATQQVSYLLILQFISDGLSVYKMPIDQVPQQVQENIKSKMEKGERLHFDSRCIVGKFLRTISKFDMVLDYSNSWYGTINAIVDGPCTMISWDDRD